MDQKKKYDALLIVSFGGPEGIDDVMPFLENVLRGKNVPEARKQEVAQHYMMFGGRSPINDYMRDLQTKLQSCLDIPVYWGNRNWKPYIKDAVLEMKRNGVQNALAYVTSAYGSYSGCRQYRENIEQARQEVGKNAPAILTIRKFYNHPKFLEANVANVRASINQFSPEEQKYIHVAFTAHSIPTSMAKASPYVEQLTEVCEKVAKELGIDNRNLVYQSRSGPPQVPWLEPDILDHIGDLSQNGVKNLVISPIGFVYDHMEVIYDLDVEAKKLCDKLEIHMVRAKTPGNDLLIIDMIKELVDEQQNGGAAFTCAPDCCSR